MGGVAVSSNSVVVEVTTPPPLTPPRKGEGDDEPGGLPAYSSKPRSMLRDEHFNDIARWPVGGVETGVFDQA